MLSISKFRGLSGEIVVGVARPGIWLSVVANIILAFLLGYIALIFQKMGALPLMLFYCLSGSFMVGIYAAPSRNGDFESGISSVLSRSGEIVDFSLRCFAANLLWFIPTLLGIQIFSHASTDPYSQFGPLSLSLTETFGVAMGFVFFICVIGPALGSIVAASTGSLSEIFKPDPWLWVVQRRRGDFCAFLSSVFGGTILFLVVYMVPLCFLSAFVQKASFENGIFLLEMIPLLPALVMPILIGRLAGAFAISDMNEDKEIPSVCEAPVHPPAQPMKHASINPALNEKNSSAAIAGAPVPLAASSPRSAEPLMTKGALTAEDISPLESDPSEELVSHLREKFKNDADISALYLCQRNKRAVVVGIEVSGDAKLAAMQRIRKLADDAAQSAPRAAQELTTSLIVPQTLEAFKAHGLCIYRKK